MARCVAMQRTVATDVGGRARVTSWAAAAAVAVAAAAEEVAAEEVEAVLALVAAEVG